MKKVLVVTNSIRKKAKNANAILIEVSLTLLYALLARTKKQIAII